MGTRLTLGAVAPSRQGGFLPLPLSATRKVGQMASEGEAARGLSPLFLADDMYPLYDSIGLRTGPPDCPTPPLPFRMRGSRNDRLCPRSRLGRGVGRPLGLSIGVSVECVDLAGRRRRRRPCPVTAGPAGHMVRSPG